MRLAVALLFLAGCYDDYLVPRETSSAYRSLPPYLLRADGSYVAVKAWNTADRRDAWLRTSSMRDVHADENGRIATQAWRKRPTKILFAVLASVFGAGVLTGVGLLAYGVTYKPDPQKLDVEGLGYTIAGGVTGGVSIALLGGMIGALCETLKATDAEVQPGRSDIRYVE